MTERARPRRKGKIVTKINEEPPEDEVQTPLCPDHTKKMIFSTKSFCWECPKDGCNYIAHPESDLDKGRPIMGRGSIELLAITDDQGDVQYLLRSTENNVFIEVTDLIAVAPYQAGDMFELTLRTNDYTERNVREMR